MILTAHQPVYLPWLGLFHKIMLADKFVFFDDVQYEKKSWINRNKLIISGKSRWLSVPVYTDNHQIKEQKIRNTSIRTSTRWQKKHWRSIYYNYKKAPYWDRYCNFFEDLYLNYEWKNISKINIYIIKYLLKQLNIEVDVAMASRRDYEGSKSQLVLNMCLEEEADLYIFGELGKNYAKADKFSENNVKVHFQSYNHPEYKQFNSEEFISHLSVLDLLFNCGPNSSSIIRKKNISKEELKTKYGLI